jgi:HlyD family secretion protein
LSPVIEVNVGTQVTGIVQKIYADFNDRVTSGQILLELDPALLKDNVEQSVAAVNKAQSSLNLALANEKRGKSLYQQKFISKQDWDQLLQTRLAATADLKLAQAGLVKDRTNLDYATIRSPVSGVIIDRQVDVGQTVTASFQTPILFKIAQDLSKMEIDSSFAEADIGNIKPGQEVTFTVDAFPQNNFSGVVKHVRLAPITQQNVVTYDVVITVENKNGILLPGMTAYVNIKTAKHKNVLIVPNAALLFKPKDASNNNSNSKQLSKVGTVYRLTGDTIEPILCNLAMVDSNYTEIASGKLKVGDAVVIGYLQEKQSILSFLKFKF